MRPLVVAVVLLLAACGDASPDAADPPTDPAPATSMAAATTTTTTDAPSVTATTPVEVAAVFLAVVEEAIEGTTLDGFADEDPETVLAIGQLFCELRDDGRTDEEALEAYLTGLASQQDLTEDDATFAGVVFGAAEATLCPTTE